MLEIIKHSLTHLIVVIERPKRGSVFDRQVADSESGSCRETTGQNTDRSPTNYEPALVKPSG